MAHTAFGRVPSRSPDTAALVTPPGFGLATLLAIEVLPSSRGSGIPQVIAAFRLPDREARGLRVVRYAGFAASCLSPSVNCSPERTSETSR